MSGAPAGTEAAVRSLARIDFDRLASLPFGVPPDTLPDERLAGWLAEGPSAATLYYSYPDEELLDPGVALPAFLPAMPGQGEVRLLPLSATGTEWTLLDAETLGQVCTPDVTDGVSGTPALGGGLVRVPWDATAAAVSLYPLPQAANESLLVHWPANDLPVNPPPLLEAPVGADDGHLLETPPDELEGELDPTWLRAPCAGLLRFERYHHLALTPDGTLYRRRPSGSGRLTLWASPLRLFPPGAVAVECDRAAGPSPLAGDLRFAFELVEARSALEPFAALLVHLTLAFDEVRATERIRQDRGLMLEYGLVGVVGWALRCWLALAEEADTDAAPAAGLRDALRRDIPAGRDPGRDAVSRAVATLASDPSGISQYGTFAREYFAEVLTGATWADLAVEIDPGALEWASDAQADLGTFQLNYPGWLPVYAGAPIGRAAPAFAAARFDNVRATWATATSTFEVEAQYQLSQWEVEDPPRQPLLGAAIESFATDDLALEPIGRLGLIRIVPPRPGEEEHTTEDWLGEVLRGTQRLRSQAPLVDFDAFAEAGHAAAGPIHWEEFLLARGARAAMDDLAVTRVSGGELQRASIAWWAAQSQFTQADGTWFTFTTLPSGVTTFTGVTPRPTDPYRPSGATTRVGNGAYDTFDLLAAVRAAGAVRDGKGAGVRQHPAVSLALAHTEGYRVMGRDRTPVYSDLAYPTKFQTIRPDHRSTWNTREWQRSIVLAWWSNTYGLDLLNKHRHPPSKTMTGPAAFTTSYAVDAEEYFRFALDPLLAPGPGGEPILDPVALPFGDVHRYAVQRVDAFWRGDVLFMARRSRQLQWLVLMLQLGVFEWHHRFLHELLTYDGRPIDPVDEFVDPSILDPGPDANSPERRRFIAYYGLVYLIFNADPDIWNAWVRRAKARPEPGFTVSESIVFGERLSLSGLSSTSKVVVGNMLRFTSALDAYLRLNLEPDSLGPPDLSDPADRNWAP